MPKGFNERLLFLWDRSPIIGYACQWLTHWLLFSKLDGLVWLVKMPTQNLLRLLLLLMLIIRNVLTPVLCKFGSWSLVIKINFVQTLSTRFGQDFEVEVQARFEAGVWSVFCCWCFVEVMMLNLGRDSEARFGQYLEV